MFHPVQAVGGGGVPDGGVVAAGIVGGARVPHVVAAAGAQHRTGIAPAHARLVRQREPVAEAGECGKRFGAGAVGGMHHLTASVPWARRRSSG